MHMFRLLNVKLQPFLIKQAASVANLLYQLITRHGSPDIIQSDQGREFVNQVCS